MRLVLATPLYPPEIGGPARYAKALRDTFMARGIKVSVVRYGRLERALPIGVRHLSYFFKLLLPVSRADAVIAFDTWSVGLPALAATALFGKKFAVRIGGDFLWESYVARTGELIKLSEFYAKERTLSPKERLIRSGTMRLLHSSTILLFNSAWQRGLWRGAYGFRADQAHVLENQFSAERDYAPPKGRMFVAAGRAHPLKNIALLEKVFAKIRKEYPDIALDTRALPPLEHEARVRDAYAMLIASVSEVNPNSAIDAIRFGKPFVAPADSGANEAVRAAGIFIDTSNAVELERAIRDLLDPDRYARATARARECSFSRSWDAVADDILKFLS